MFLKRVSFGSNESTKHVHHLVSGTFAACLHIVWNRKGSVLIKTWNLPNSPTPNSLAYTFKFIRYGNIAYEVLKLISNTYHFCRANNLYQTESSQNRHYIMVIGFSPSMIMGCYNGPHEGNCFFASPLLVHLCLFSMNFA